MSWKKVCDVDSLWEGEKVCFKIDDNAFLVIKLNGQIFVYSDQCPHQRASLAEGDLEDHILTCSVHCWQFDVLTGKGVNPTSSRLTSWPVKVDDNVVYVDTQAPLGETTHV